MTTKNKIIVGVSIAVILSGVAYLIWSKMPKKDAQLPTDGELPKADSEPVIPPAGTPAPVVAKAPAYYSAIVKPKNEPLRDEKLNITRKTTNENEIVGNTKGATKTINQQTYLIFFDKNNGYKKSLVLKSRTNYAKN